MTAAALHTQALETVELVDPTLSKAESQALRAVAAHETQYGTGWEQGHGAGSNNMGAIMTGETAETCSGFTHGDSNPDKPFTGCFKVYSTPEKGWADLIRVMLKSNVRTAANRGDLRGVAAAMFDNHYYTGTSHDPNTNIERYFSALRRNLDEIIQATGEADEFEPKANTASGKTRGKGLLLTAGVLALGYAAYKYFSKPARSNPVVMRPPGGEPSPK